MHRGYSWLNVRAVDEDKRTIEGIATTPTQARDGDVLETAGIQFNLPLPFLYRHSEPMGNVVEAKSDKNGIRVKVQVAPAGVSEKIDEYWRLVKSGTVRGLSIGWRTLQELYDKEIGGYRILKSEWLELSAVPVPADANATITSVRSADALLLAALGREEKRIRPDRQARNLPGVSGSPKGKPAMKGLKERIAALEQKRSGLQEQMTEIDNAMLAENRDIMTAEEAAEYDPIAAEARGIDAQIARLRAMDSSASTAQPVIADPNGSGQRQTRTSLRPSGDIEVNKAKAPQGIGLARAAIAMVRAKGNPMFAEQLARKHYRDSPEVASYLEWLGRAAVEAGDTTTSGWAAALYPPAQQLQGEFLGALVPATIVGKVRNFRRVPFNVQVPVQTTAVGVGWVGEAKAKPVTKQAWTTASLSFAKIAAIVAITDELAMFSSPSAEELIRVDMINQVKKFQDAQFIDPSITGSALRPQSLLNGKSKVGDGGGATAADFRHDFQTLVAAYLANSQPLSSATILMSETIAAGLAAMQTDLGVRDFPGITAMGGEYMGIPIIASESVSDRLVLFNAAEVLLAQEPSIRIDVSTEATLEMDTEPLTGESSPVETAVLKSLWQNNLVGIRCEQRIRWQRGRDSAVEWLDNVTYAPAAPDA